MNDAFGKRLADLLRATGMSDRDFAKKIGTSNSAVSRWTHGTSLPMSEILMRICKELDVSADYLLFGRDNFPTEKSGTSEDANHAK